MKRRLVKTLATVVVAVGTWTTPAGAQRIQPGESIVSSTGYCTLNWIYDGPGGATYAGTAAHCVDRVGQAVSLATGSLGEPIERIGTVAFRGDPTEDANSRDYAFIRIDAEDLGQVDPNLKGHPGIPTGVSTGYAQGDLMQFSGNGVAFHLTAPTREQRVGILNWTGGGEHWILGPVTNGDSGGPVANLSDGGTAFGIVDTLTVGAATNALTVVQAGEGGANLDFVLRDAARRGFPLTLRTAR